MVDSWRINQTGKYNFFHNDHDNNSYSLNTKNVTEKKEKKNFHLHLSLFLNTSKCTWYHKKVPTVLNVPICLKKETLVIKKTEDRFDEGYDIDGERGNFYDVEGLEDNQYFD